MLLSEESNAALTYAVASSSRSIATPTFTTGDGSFSTDVQNVRFGSKPHGSSKFKGSTFNDQTPSDRSSFSGILLGMRHEETGKS